MKKKKKKCYESNVFNIFVVGFYHNYEEICQTFLMDFQRVYVWARVIRLIQKIIIKRFFFTF